MQFKHPELLWALVLLAIPIIIHLFQLRRFQKVSFTNVKFLQSVVQQTRKSSQIKKWLTLIARLLTLGCIILAFAQPYTSEKADFKTKSETVIYLDNSLSLQAQGSNGSLLNGAIQELLTYIPQGENITVFTNDKVFKDITIKSISNQLITLNYSPKQLSYEAAYLKGSNFFSQNGESIKNFIMLSDFQQNSELPAVDKSSDVNLKLVSLTPVEYDNVSIDSIYIDNPSSDNFDLKVKLNHSGDLVNSVSISLHNRSELVAKTAIDFESSNEASFSLPAHIPIDGILSIEDSGLDYDNRFYFNLNVEEKIKVLSINEADDSFLQRMFTDDEFVFTSQTLSSLNYNTINDNNLLILNELKRIPSSLIPVIENFMSNDRSLLIIPSNEIDKDNYNQLLRGISNMSFASHNENVKRITTIHFNHPILENAFYKSVTNFQYPRVDSSFQFNSNSDAIFSFEDGAAFLKGSNKVYVFSASLKDENTNFKSSPLIVPALYTIGKKSLKLPNLYYTIGTETNLDVETQIGQDDILSLASENGTNIPLQQTYSNKVSMTLGDFPQTAGFISVNNGSETLKTLSFNFSRSESDLTYHKLNENNGYNLSSSLTSAIEDIKSGTNVNELWKWFVIFAMLFLITEMLILKYLK